MPGTPRALASDDFGAGLLSLSFGRNDPTMEGTEPSILPPAFRQRLYGLFNQIEGEFEALYAENLQCECDQMFLISLRESFYGIINHSNSFISVISAGESGCPI